jgi:hypothetical protein
MYKYDEQLCHSSHKFLMMEAEKVIKMVETHSVETWLIV